MKYSRISDIHRMKNRGPCYLELENITLPPKLTFYSAYIDHCTIPKGARIIKRPSADEEYFDNLKLKYCKGNMLLNIEGHKIKSLSLESILNTVINVEAPIHSSIVNGCQIFIARKSAVEGMHILSSVIFIAGEVYEITCTDGSIMFICENSVPKLKRLSVDKRDRTYIFVIKDQNKAQDDNGEEALANIKEAISDGTKSLENGLCLIKYLAPNFRNSLLSAINIDQYSSCLMALRSIECSLLMRQPSYDDLYHEEGLLIDV